jgi:hypothetical protein
VHELTHLHEPNHTPEFWRRLERALPDYQARRTWLAEQGMEYTLQVLGGAGITLRGRAPRLEFGGWPEAI